MYRLIYPIPFLLVTYCIILILLISLVTIVRLNLYYYQLPLTYPYISYLPYLIESLLVTYYIL